MSEPAAPISDDLLHDLIEGRLGPLERAFARAALARSPKLAARMRALRRQHEALQEIGRPILHEPVPERLVRVLARRREPATGRRARRVPVMLAATAAVLLS
jgi:anti-sigma factor RsiW